jgi:ABC-2 type transport system ATP-binding protein
MTMVVQAHEVWKRFRSHDALRGLNLNVEEGSAYALIGANGAGKTTTLKLLMNILAPTRGEVSVMGVPTQQFSHALLTQIGYVSENQVLPARLTLGQYLDYLRPFYPAWDRELETSTCARLHVPLNRRIGELSHGTRMKAALACALPFRPKLLILDEPFSGVDALVREEFMEGLLLQAGDLTLIVSSQELGEIETVATHVGFLDAGRMLFEESMSDLQARIRELRVVLERPALTAERPAALPSPWPATWLRAQVFGNVISFVDTRYSPAATEQLIHELLAPVKQIDAQPLPLRTVFTTLARAARDGAQP